MADVSRPEAHAMDINTVNLWLTNAKHQPTKSVEIEGTPATRQASLTEFFTSVATSAAFEVAGALVSYIAANGLETLKGFTSADDLVGLAAQYGDDAYVVTSAGSFIKTKIFITQTTNKLTSFVDDLTKPVGDLFESGYNAVKEAFVNPIGSTYTEAISKATSAATAYVSQASSLTSVGLDNAAMLAAKQFTDQTTLPTLQGVKDHSDNLVTGNFTVNDAVVAAAPTEPSAVSIWSANPQYEDDPYQPVNNNIILQCLGFQDSPTFEDMCGILSKEELHSNMLAARNDEEEKREDLNDALQSGTSQQRIDAYAAWQNSFNTYKNTILALRTETRNNVKQITKVIAQESSLTAINKVSTTRSLISDPAILAVYNSCLTDEVKDAADALDFFVQGPPAA